MTDCPVEDLLTKKVLIRQYAVACDIHPFVKGASWEGVRDRQVKGALKGVEVGFASLEDLIRMKEAAGRPKDLEDLRHLRLLRPPG